LQSDEFGRELFTFDTMVEALATIEQTYRECQGIPGNVERVIGLIVKNQHEWVCPACGGRWTRDNPDLIHAPSGEPYCPACEEAIMQRA
jgi:predicted RNA-binding Zn-ribbon protein involved in translation (DUF1610 family)